MTQARMYTHMSPGCRVEACPFQQEPRTLPGLGALTPDPKDSGGGCLLPGPPPLGSDFLIIWIVSATHSKGMNQPDLSGGKETETQKGGGTSARKLARILE
ncbi:unnamed protein product [Rangifer tarandus platyrhynchus]|uniref:Uncharacterized protein n=1 Tax=Rangifer tarandus platyrhynchus TaxID=3082113 RepID=A0AC59YYL7_RANTA